MGHPRRSTVDVICDYFADLAPERQDGLLITLAAIHRQAKRTRNGNPLAIVEELLERNAALDLDGGTKQ